MVTFLPFDPSHLALLDLQPAQWEFASQVKDRAYGAMLRDTGVAVSAIVPDANGVRLIGCAGIVPQWPGRAVAWVLMGRARKNDWTPIVRRMRAMIASAHRTGTTRIEATCDTGFGPGKRLLTLLGFRIEGTMDFYSPEGRAHHLYAHFGEPQ